MTSGFKELTEEPRCAALKQPCSGLHRGKSDTNVTKDPRKCRSQVPGGQRAGRRLQGRSIRVEMVLMCTLQFSHGHISLLFLPMWAPTS